MAAIEQRTVTLPSEQAQFVDQLVRSGGYASVSDVVQAGLAALKERVAATDRWLWEDVAPVYDAMQFAPERARSADQVANRVSEHHEAKVKRDCRGA